MEVVSLVVMEPRGERPGHVGSSENVVAAGADGRALLPPEREGGEDGWTAARTHLGHLRSQLAVVRALADQVDRVSAMEEDGGLRDQLIEELARLGCRLLEEADSLTRSGHGEDSGIFVTPAAR